jgi:RiboL-PSP-HEPN
MTGRGEMARLKQRLDTTFGRAPPPSAEIELQSDFARYLCVLVSGFLENAIVALILDFAQRRSATEIAAFVERELNYWTNPNTEKICALLGSFNPDWRKQSELFLVDERKEGVNSLVALRHKIAHGESVGTSLSQVKAYYATILKVLDFVANLVEP